VQLLGKHNKIVLSATASAMLASVRSDTIKNSDILPAVLNSANCDIHFDKTWHVVDHLTVISMADPGGMSWLHSAGQLFPSVSFFGGIA
jgi:hypothetical protein